MAEGWDGKTLQRFLVVGAEPAVRAAASGHVVAVGVDEGRGGCSRCGWCGGRSGCGCRGGSRSSCDACARSSAGAAGDSATGTRNEGWPRRAGGAIADIGIAVNAQDLSPAAIAASTPAAFQRNHLVRTNVVEIEHVIRLALEEQGRVAVGFQLEAVPEEGALAGAVPVAAHKIGIAVQRLRRPFLQQVALVIEPVKLRREPAANGDLVRRTLLPAESPAAATPTLGSCTRSRPTRSCPTRSRPTRSCPTPSCRTRRLQAGRRCA